jgi:hypothetical protein
VVLLSCYGIVLGPKLGENQVLNGLDRHDGIAISCLKSDIDRYFNKIEESMAVDAVFGEPLSGCISLQTGKLTGKPQNLG